MFPIYQFHKEKLSYTPLQELSILSFHPCLLSNSFVTLSDACRTCFINFGMVCLFILRVGPAILTVAMTFPLLFFTRTAIDTTPS